MKWRWRVSGGQENDDNDNSYLCSTCSKPDVILSTLYIVTHLILTLWGRYYRYRSFTEEETGTEKLSVLSKVMQLKSNDTGVLVQAIWLLTLLKVF